MTLLLPDPVPRMPTGALHLSVLLSGTPVSLLREERPLDETLLLLSLGEALYDFGVPDPAPPAQAAVLTFALAFQTRAPRMLELMTRRGLARIDGVLIGQDKPLLYVTDTVTEAGEFCSPTTELIDPLFDLDVATAPFTQIGRSGTTTGQPEHLAEAEALLRAVAEDLPELPVLGTALHVPYGEACRNGNLPRPGVQFRLTRPGTDEPTLTPETRRSYRVILNRPRDPGTGGLVHWQSSTVDHPNLLLGAVQRAVTHWADRRRNPLPDLADFNLADLAAFLGDPFLSDPALTAQLEQQDVHALHIETGTTAVTDWNFDTRLYLKNGHES